MNLVMSVDMSIYFNLDERNYHSKILWKGMSACFVVAWHTLEQLEILLWQICSPVIVYIFSSYLLAYFCFWHSFISEFIIF